MRTGWNSFCLRRRRHGLVKRYFFPDLVVPGLEAASLVLVETRKHSPDLVWWSTEGDDMSPEFVFNEGSVVRLGLEALSTLIHFGDPIPRLRGGGDDG